MAWWTYLIAGGCLFWLFKMWLMSAAGVFDGRHPKGRNIKREREALAALRKKEDE